MLNDCQKNIELVLIYWSQYVTTEIIYAAVTLNIEGNEYLKN